MPYPFDPGYFKEPFLTLASEYPRADVYPPDQFRVEWGPIFHRGRLDGSARVLVIGQDPAQHETVVRRILVGEAGRRLQGLLAKLGVTKSYVCVNTFLYSVYGSVKAKRKKDMRLIDCRNRWIDALIACGRIEAVLALGSAADEAWKLCKKTSKGKAFKGAYAPVMHPTYRESFSKGDKAKLAEATKRLLKKWNGALQQLQTEIVHPDLPTPLLLYGEIWADGERPQVPAIDFPAGLPTWMHERDVWARRVGKDDLEKRRSIVIKVPKGIVQ